LVWVVRVRHGLGAFFKIAPGPSQPKGWEFGAFFKIAPYSSHPPKLGSGTYGLARLGKGRTLVPPGGT
jgi:hypothetical protein